MADRELFAKRRNDSGFTDHRQVADWYDAKYTEMQGGWVTPVHEIDHHLYQLGLPSDARGMSLVDLGSGDGQLLMRAVLSGAECWGVEISSVGRDMTWQRFKQLQSSNDSEFSLGVTSSSMEETGFFDAEFDFAISLGSMEHALDIDAAVREMARILKPGGRWLLYVPNEEWIHEDQPLETAAEAEWWVRKLVAAGLVVGNIERVNDNNRITGIKPRWSAGYL